MWGTMTSVLLLVSVFTVTLVSGSDVANQCKNGVWNAQTQTCKCKAGYSGRHCEIDIVCCNIWGDPHYLTFDGAKISFQGSCKYTAVAWCACCCMWWIKPKTTSADKPDFRVEVKNWKRGNADSKVTWVRYAEARILGNDYVLDLDKTVTVNGANVTLPYNKNGVNIGHSGGYVRIDTKFGASIQYDGKARLVICVPKIWHDLCGICGNNNGIKNDDYQRKDGVDVSGRLGQAGPEIGNSWQVNDAKDAECRTEARDQSPKPSPKWEKLVQNKEYCGLITNKDSVYKKCIAHFGNDKINSFYTNCKFDVYETAQDPKVAKKVACESLAALATECEEIGFTVANWRSQSKCPLKCPKNQIFSYNTSPCQPTCADPDAPKTCKRENNEGCTCTKGLILSGEKCIKPSMCACTEADGSYHEPNEMWFSKDCKTKFRCVSTKPGTAPVITTSAGCGHGETCKAVDGVMTCVKIPVAGGWSEWTKWSECVKFGEEDFEVRVRVRACDNPAPLNGGKCKGSVYETFACVPGAPGPVPEPQPEEEEEVGEL